MAYQIILYSSDYPYGKDARQRGLYRIRFAISLMSSTLDVSGEDPFIKSVKLMRPFKIQSVILHEYSVSLRVPCKCSTWNRLKPVSESFMSMLIRM